MSNRATLFTASSLQTFLATAFILALLGTGIATYSVARLRQVEDAVIDMRIQQARLTEAEAQYRLRALELEQRIEALELLPRHAHDADPD